jgi:hypothetical protein
MKADLGDTGISLVQRHGMGRKATPFKYRR